MNRYVSVFSPCPDRGNHGDRDGLIYNPDSVVVSPCGRFIVASSPTSSLLIDTVERPGELQTLYTIPYRSAGFMSGSRFIVLELINDTIMVIDTELDPMEDIYTGPGKHVFLSQSPGSTMCGFTHDGDAYILAHDVKEDLLYRRRLRASKFDSTVWLWDQMMRPFGYARQIENDVKIALLPTAGRIMYLTTVENHVLGDTLTPLSFYSNDDTGRWELFMTMMSPVTGEHSLSRFCVDYTAPDRTSLVREDVFIPSSGRIFNVLIAVDGAPYAVEWWDGCRTRYEVMDGIPQPKHHAILDRVTSYERPPGRHILTRLITDDTAVIVDESLTEPASVTVIAGQKVIRDIPSCVLDGAHTCESTRSKPVHFQSRDHYPLKYSLVSLFPGAVSIPAWKRKDAPPALCYVPGSMRDSVLYGCYSSVLASLVGQGVTVMTPYVRGFMSRHADDNSDLAVMCDVLDAIALATYNNFVKGTLVLSAPGTELSFMLDMLELARKRTHRVSGAVALYPVLDFHSHEKLYKSVKHQVIVIPSPGEPENKVRVEYMTEQLPHRVLKNYTFVVGGHDYRSREESALNYVSSLISRKIVN